MSEAARLLEAATSDLCAAACALHRGGRRGEGTHVSVTVESWNALVAAREAYRAKLNAATAPHACAECAAGDVGGGNPIARSVPEGA